jgi:hypothetical protein
MAPSLAPRDQGKLSFAESVIHGLKEADFPAIYPVNP